MKESRREFIKKSGCALGMTALATQMQHFGLVDAMAQSIDPMALTGYKALVLCYFDGGNDGNNMVVPIHDVPVGTTGISNYTTYTNARGTQGLALPRTGAGSLLPINVPGMGTDYVYGLHPAFGALTRNIGANIINNGIHELYQQGKMAIVPNVGTLVRPTTKAQMGQSSHPKPYQLYSHSDQTNQNQNAYANRPIFTGWGGRIADAMRAGVDPANIGGLIPMVTSISGAQIFTAAQASPPLAIGQANTVTIPLPTPLPTPNLRTILSPAGFGNTGGTQRRTSLNQILGEEVLSNANFVKESAKVLDTAMRADAAFATANEVAVEFPNTSLGQQLRQVARLIQMRSSLTMNRQIFFVRIGGFDTHTDQLGAHNNLFTQFSQAARSFYDAMGALGVQNDVTMFTLSDFGRTFNPAGSGSGVGSDHAWGNHCMVIGGSVLGGNFYGLPTSNGTPYPNLAFNGTDDADGGTGARGRWIPSTSVEQYAATLARWYGLPQDSATLQTVFPNINNFNMASGALNFLP